MDKVSIARIRIRVLTAEKKRIDKELRRCKALIKKSRTIKEPQV
jgi:hypothetical protein